MLQVNYVVFTVYHPAVAVELKVDRTVIYPLTQMMSMADEHNQVYVYFILKLLRIPKTVVTC